MYTKRMMKPWPLWVALLVVAALLSGCPRGPETGPGGGTPSSPTCVLGQSKVGDCVLGP